MHCDSRFESEATAARSMALSYPISAANLQDVRAMADVLASSFHRQEGWEGWVYPLLRLGIGEDLRGRLRSPDRYYACLKAIAIPSHQPRREGMPPVVGTVEIAWKRSYFWPLVGLDGPYISNLAVRSSYRRQGIARRLLQACEAQARAWQSRTLYLHVLETNEEAYRLYTNAGFQDHAIEDSLAFQWFGAPRQILMRKRLEP